jgi:aminopeptidase N
VNVQTSLTQDQLLNLLAHDSDPFNQWDAAQRLYVQSALHAIDCEDLPERVLNDALLSGMRTLLRNPELDPAFKEVALSLPSESYLAEQLKQLDPVKVHKVREKMREEIACALCEDWAWAYQAHPQSRVYTPDALSCGKRALSGLCLSMLCLAQSIDASLSTHDWAHTAFTVFSKAQNMTDRMNALSALIGCGSELAQAALNEFYKLYKHEPLVMDKWFAIQASSNSRGGDVLAKVKSLMQHPDFEIKNPNRARSLIFSYCVANPASFHKADASGYVFWSERILEIDAFNAQVAARLARALDKWKNLVEPYRTAACEALKRVAAKNDLSNDVKEVVTRALSD